MPVFAASLHYVLTFVTFEGRNITQRSVNSMLKSVFSDLCVDYATENDTVVLRFPVKPGMTMFEYRVVKVFTGISLIYGYLKQDW